MYEFMIKKYEKTHWPYFSINDLVYEGVFSKDEARKLYNEGKIKVAEGINSKLIMLIEDEINT